MEDTLPKLLVYNARRFDPRKIAVREKDYGIWQQYTWREYLQMVEIFALGLASLGLERGDKIAIIGDNRPEWLAAELAAQSLGGVAVGLYQDAVAKELAYIIDHSDSKFIVVEDQEQVDKVLDIKSELPKLKKVVYWDPKGMRSYHDELLLSFGEVQELGRQFQQAHPDYFQQQLQIGQADEVAVIAYTSGTTGFPKGAMLSHRNLLSMAEHFTQVDPIYPADDFVSFLPLAWIGEQMISVACFLKVGFTIDFPEEPETVQENIREIGPQIMFAPPRIWENMVSTVQVRIEDSSALKRWLFYRFLPVAQRIADAKFSHKTPGPIWRLLYRLGDALVFQPIKDHLGLLRIRRAYTGGAPLGPEVFKFFHALGVNIKQIYGQTEISGISVVHRDDDIRFETVGQPIPNTELKVSDTGEIISRSPSVFLGYYKNPEATADTLRDGWLHSGDAGIIDEQGHLIVIDRMKDVMRLSDGSKFSPQYIENKLKFSPYVKEAVVVGQDRPYLIVLVNIEMANVGKWAENRQVGYTTYTDLAQKPEVYELILQEVRRVNRDLPRVAQIRKFLLLHKELDADDEELTRTRKVRRGFVEQRYGDLIEAMYGGADHVVVETDVKYRDGRQARIEARLRIMALESEAVGVR